MLAGLNSNLTQPQIPVLTFKNGLELLQVQMQVLFFKFLNHQSQSWHIFSNPRTSGACLENQVGPHIGTTHSQSPKVTDYMLSSELPKEHYTLSRLEIAHCIGIEFYN
jgi:hypothetical protein